MQLVPMTQAEFDAFLVASPESYAADMKRAFDMAPEVAKQMAQAQFKSLLPDGLATKDHWLLTVKDENGSSVGHFWYAIREIMGARKVFICDIHLGPASRGKGYGTKMLTWLEDRCRELGLTEIGLHVFGHNTGARKLYEALGYEATSVQMSKKIESSK